MPGREGRPEIPPEARGPEVRDIKLKNAWDTQEERDQVYDAVTSYLKEINLPVEAALARGFEGTPGKVKTMLKTGIEHPDARLFAMSVKNIPNTDEFVYDPIRQSPMSFADMSPRRALAIYDARKLAQEATQHKRDDRQWIQNPKGNLRRALLVVFKIPKQ